MKINKRSSMCLAVLLLVGTAFSLSSWNSSYKSSRGEMNLLEIYWMQALEENSKLESLIDLQPERNRTANQAVSETTLEINGMDLYYQRVANLIEDVTDSTLKLQLKTFYANGLSDFKTKKSKCYYNIEKLQNEKAKLGELISALKVYYTLPIALKEQKSLDERNDNLKISQKAFSSLKTKASDLMNKTP